jgi:hypothetical protein
VHFPVCALLTIDSFGKTQQAAHWFDYPTLWPELGRVLKSNGTAAFWVCIFLCERDSPSLFADRDRRLQTYGSNYLPSHPDLAPMMMEFMNSHSEKLGPYWPQPGRRILENLLADIPFPTELKDNEAEAVKWDKSSATRIAHKLESDGIPDLAWTRGHGKEETFRMEVRETPFAPVLSPFLIIFVLLSSK